MGETKKKKPHFIGLPPLKSTQRAKLEKDFKLGRNQAFYFIPC